MNISTLAVRRGVTFSILFVIVVGFGLFSLSRLALDLYPDISFPSVVIITNYTGASPEDIETLVTRPLEGAVASVKDAEEIVSTSKPGASVIQVNFDWGKDMEQAETDVRRSLDLVRSLLPDDASDPIVFAFDPSLQPVVMMMVTGPYPLDELRRIAEQDIQPRLERLPGIATAETAGGLEREIQVVLDPAKVAAFGLDANAIVGAVYQGNVQVPGGSFQPGNLDFTIQTRGKYQSVADIGEVVVGAKPGEGGPVPVRLKDVARVQDSFYETERILEVDGVPAVWMMVRKQSGGNTVRAAEVVVEALPEIKRAVAADVDFAIIFNQADFINLALGNLSTSGLAGVALTFLVLMFFVRNLRSALIVASAIPSSVIATFFAMDQAGMTLNVISLAGLGLAVGMVVDNSIVVLENIYRLREEGVPPWEAASRGASTVGMAITASTLTTVAVFVPVLFVPGIAGVMFRDMAVTICLALTVSLAVALTFVPLAASRLLSAESFAKVVSRTQHSVALSRMRTGYAASLTWVLARRKQTAALVTACVLTTVGIAILLPTDFTHQDDNSFVFVTVETAISNNLAEAGRVFQEITTKLEEAIPAEERELIGTDIGMGKGFMSIFGTGVHAGLVRVKLVPASQRSHSQQEIEEDVREALRSVPGIKYKVAMPFNPMGEGGDIEVQIRGHDLEESRRVGMDLREQLAALPEMAEVVFSMEDQKPQVGIDFDRRKMGQLGLSTAAVGNAISTFFQGRVAGRFADGGDEFDILVRYGRDYRRDINELRRMPVVSLAGAVVPLANVAAIKEELGPVSITRLDQARVTRVNCTLKKKYVDASGDSHRKNLGASIRQVQGILAKYDFPSEFTYHVGGTAEDFLKSFKYLGLALLVSILLVYLVMASQFESFREPFIILFTMPLCAIGVVLMFVLTQSTVEVGALVGLIILAGVVVNNGIVMVDAANQLREQGLDIEQAIYKASLMRMRPVLMTAATTILAMLPLALEIGEGAAFWSGLAKTVIAGLTSASLLTLFVVPMVYTVFARRQRTARTEAANATQGGRP